MWSFPSTIQRTPGAQCQRQPVHSNCVSGPVPKWESCENADGELRIATTTVGAGILSDGKASNERRRTIAQRTSEGDDGDLENRHTAAQVCKAQLSIASERRRFGSQLSLAAPRRGGDRRCIA
jgi:hypothetical protein